MAVLLCPFLMIARGASGGMFEERCIEERCALWDEGIFDECEPGCGLSSRENRRV